MRVSLATTPGSSNRRNEDWCGASLDVAIVLDGVTSGDDDDGGCRHGTPWYVRHLGLALLEFADADMAKSLKEALAQSIAWVASLHAECDLGHPGTPSATVGMLRPSGESIEYLVLSDATSVLSLGETVETVTDRRVRDVTQEAMQDCYEVPTGSDEQNRRIRAMILKQREVRNKPGGYWLAGAVPEAAHHGVSGRRAWQQRDAALLLSDGASCLVDTYGRTTWPGLVDLARFAGLGQILKAVRAAEASDPEGARWPRFKSSDDATAVLVQNDL